MYIGEVNVKQTELASLVSVAECLRIKGLAVPDEINETSTKSAKLNSNESDFSKTSISEQETKKKMDSIHSNVNDIEEELLKAEIKFEPDELSTADSAMDKSNELEMASTSDVKNDNLDGASSLSDYYSLDRSTFETDTRSNDINISDSSQIPTFSHQIQVKNMCIFILTFYILPLDEYLVGSEGEELEVLACEVVFFKFFSCGASLSLGAMQGVGGGAGVVARAQPIYLDILCLE